VQFPGPVAQTVHYSSPQFIVFPVGLLSIADYLDRHGYSIHIANLGESMLSDSDFDVEDYIKKLESRVYAVEMHWCVHVQGSIEIARICKKYHPNALVILGGLTATCFHNEIVRNYTFVDAVIRGEAEEATLELAQKMNAPNGMRDVPNLTYRDRGNRLRANPQRKPVADLDEFEFTRLDLVSPKRLSLGTVESWSIPLCRGCTRNCVTCGGSAHAYRTLCGRERPALRSPARVVEDIKRLEEQGIRHVFLFQDPRDCGEKYWRKLFELIRAEKPLDRALTFELFSPANDEYLRSLSKVDCDIRLTISPESGDESVRRTHGREYSNEELRLTMQLCQKYRVPLAVFFMVGLSSETRQTIRKTWEIIEDISRLGPGLVSNVGPMISLDPGSLAFDFPREHGYRLFFRTLEDYRQAAGMPSWHQWISYETHSLARHEISDLALQSLVFLLHSWKKYDLDRLDQVSLSSALFDLSSNYIIFEEVDRILQFRNPQEVEVRLKDLKASVEDCHNKAWGNTGGRADPYGYRRELSKVVHRSIDLMHGG